MKLFIISVLMSSLPSLSAAAQQFTVSEALLGRCTAEAATARQQLAEAKAELTEASKLVAYWRAYAGMGEAK